MSTDSMSVLEMLRTILAATGGLCAVSSPAGGSIELTCFNTTGVKLVLISKSFYCLLENRSQLLLFLHCRHCCGVSDASAPSLAVVMSIKKLFCRGWFNTHCFKMFTNPNSESRGLQKWGGQVGVAGLGLPSKEHTAWEIQHDFQVVDQFV